MISYLIQRFFRLYPPVLVTKILAIALLCVLDWRMFHIGLPDEFNLWVGKARSVDTVYKYFLEVSLVSDNLNPVAWSIYVEVICSMLLPAIVCLVAWFPRCQLGLALVLGYILHFEQIDPLNHMLPRLGYLFTFLMGYVIFRNLDKLRRLSAVQTVVGIVALLVAWVISIQNEFNLVVESLILALILCFLAPCNLGFLRRFLESNTALKLGRLSFSFYLIHPLVLYVIVPVLVPLHTGRFQIDLALLFMLSGSISLCFALIMERFIERPSNAFGKWVGAKLGGEPTAQVTIPVQS